MRPLEVHLKDVVKFCVEHLDWKKFSPLLFAKKGVKLLFSEKREV